MVDWRSPTLSMAVGEVDPTLVGRADLDLYQRAVRRFRNAWPLASGGAKRRPGLQSVWLTNGEDIRFETFVFDDDEQYLLAFQPGSLRVFSPAGETIWFAEGMPWNTAVKVEALDYLQSNDAMILVQKGMTPQVLRRTSLTSFSVRPIEWEQLDSGMTGMPFWKPLAGDMTLAVSSISSSVGKIVSSDDWFDPKHVGQLFRIRGREFRITSVQGPREARGEPHNGFPIDKPTVTWEEGAFHRLWGFPRTVTMFDSRLCFAGTKAQPNAIWMSRVGAYWNFDRGEGADHEAIYVELNADPIKGNPVVEYLVSGDRLYACTNIDVRVSAPANTATITPGSARFRPAHDKGTRRCRPVLWDAELYMAARGDGSVIRIRYDSDRGWSGADIATSARHLATGLRRLRLYTGTAAGLPESILMMPRVDGSLAIAWRSDIDEAYGWGLWTTDGAWKDVAVCGGEMWNAVIRLATTATEPLLSIERTDAAVHVDQAWVGSTPSPGMLLPTMGGAVVQGVSGAIPLEAQKLDDANPIAQWGVAQLNQVGRAYSMQIQPLPVDAYRTGQPLLGSKRRIWQIVLLLHETLRVRVDDTILPEQAAEAGIAGDWQTWHGIEPLTGMVSTRLLGVDQDSAGLMIEASDAAPATILGFILDTVILWKR